MRAVDLGGHLRLQQSEISGAVVTVPEPDELCDVSVYVLAADVEIERFTGTGADADV